MMSRNHHESATTSLLPEVLDAPGPIRSNSVHKKLMDDSSNLAGLQAKINFLQTCYNHDITPPGFKLKWHEETGLKSPVLTMNVYNILASSTKLLLKEVLTATKKKFMEKASSVIQCKYKIPVEGSCKLQLRLQPGIT